MFKKMQILQFCFSNFINFAHFSLFFVMFLPKSLSFIESFSVCRFEWFRCESCRSQKQINVVQERDVTIFPVRTRKNAKD